MTPQRFSSNQNGVNPDSTLMFNFIKDLKQHGGSREQDQSEIHSLLPYLYMYKFNSDNIGYVLMEPQTKQLIAVDTGEFERSHAIVAKLEERHAGSRLTHILSTHKHPDHVGGNQQWLEERPDDLKIVGSSLEIDQIPGLLPENAMGDLQTFTLGDLCICCLETPGHTTDHVSFVITHVTPESNKNPFLFCGDTLFIGGCGRILGGTSSQLLESLQKLMALPNETLVFCGHEYTIKNLEFAEMLEPDNTMIQSKLDMCRSTVEDHGEFTVGSPLMDERLVNPFVRCFAADTETRAYYEKISGEDKGDGAPVGEDGKLERVFAKLRKLKDTF